MKILKHFINELSSISSITLFFVDFRIKMQSFQNKTKEMFIVRALEKILTDKDIKRQGQLKKACESAITSLKGLSKCSNSLTSEIKISSKFQQF